MSSFGGVSGKTHNLKWLLKCSSLNPPTLLVGILIGAAVWKRTEVPQKARVGMCSNNPTPSHSIMFDSL